MRKKPSIISGAQRIERTVESVLLVHDGPRVYDLYQLPISFHLAPGLGEHQGMT